MLNQSMNKKAQILSLVAPWSFEYSYGYGESFEMSESYMGHLKCSSFFP